MFTKIFRKALAKIATISLLVSMLSPFASIVQADVLGGELNIGVNIQTAEFAVYSAADAAASNWSNPIMEKEGSDCTLIPTGYYTCTRDNLMTGAYVVHFTPEVGYDDPEIIVNGTPQPTYTENGKVAFAIQLSEGSMDVWGYYGLPGPETGELNVGVNLNLADAVMTVRDASNAIVMQKSGNECGWDAGTGHYICTRDNLLTGAYTVEFSDVTTYETPEAELIQLTTAGLTVLGTYELPGVDTGELRIGINLANGGFTVRDALNAVVMDKEGVDCTNEGAGYYVCTREIEVGAYSVTFDDVVGYDLPTNNGQVFQLTTSGLEIMGTYTIPGPETGDLSVGVNIADGGYTIRDASNAVVATKTGSECPLVGGYFTCEHNGLLTGAYTVTFDSVTTYNTPSTEVVQLTTSGEDVYGYYSSTPSGVVEVDVIDQYGAPFNPGSNAWSVKTCATADPASCTTDLMNGGPGDMVSGASYNYYRVFLDNTPADYQAIVTPSQYQELSSTNDYIEFTIQYLPIGGDEVLVEVRAELDGTPSAVDFRYCVGDQVTFACDDIETTTYTIAALESGDQFIAISREAGYGIPQNNINLEAAQDLALTGLENYYYYSIDQDDLDAGEIEFAYTSMDETAEIEVTIDGPAGMSDAEISIERVDTSALEVDHEAIVNQTSETFEVGVEDTGTDFMVYCHDVPGYVTLDSDHLVNNLMPDALEQVTCRYAEELAYINVKTSPVIAQVNFEPTSNEAAQDDQMQLTSVFDDDTSYYGVDGHILSEDDRFYLVVPSGDTQVDEDFSITCMPTIDGYMAPTNSIWVENGPYNANTTTMSALCEYTEADPSEVVTITIDTLNVGDAAIYVDGIEVRPTDTFGEVTATIYVGDEHVITFEDKDPTNFRTPEAIVIPADTLDSTMTGDELRYLGYYVPLGNETLVEFNTVTQNGNVYVVFPNTDTTMWCVGHADTTATPLQLYIDEAVAHEFHFQDRNMDIDPAVLRAVPVTYGGFAIAQNINLNVDIVDSFQEYYTYDGSQDFSETLALTGQYISTDDAAFFQARTTNTDVFGDMTLTTGDENSVETLNPGANTWTRTFVSDVTNDTDDNIVFENTTYASEDYVAIPASYTLSDFATSNVRYDLESTYYTGLAEVTVRLVSFDPLVQPTAGLEVTMDVTETEYTVDTGTDIEAQFSNVSVAADHNVVCPEITGLLSPNEVYIPANTLDPSDPTNNVFYCLYAPTTGAEIQIQTTASDIVDFEAPITLNVDSVDYNLGYTQSSDPASFATMELWIDHDAANTIIYGEMLPYATPASVVVNVDAGSTYTDPAYTDSNTFLGEYLTTATINVYTMDETTPAADGVDDAVITLTNLDTLVSQEIAGVGDTGTALNIDVTPGIDYRIDFGTHPTDVTYTSPLSIYFNLESGDTAHYLGIYTKNTCQVEYLRWDDETDVFISPEVMITVNSIQYSIGTGDPVSDYLVTYNIDSTQAEGTYVFNFMQPTDQTFDNIDPSSDSLPQAAMVCPYQLTVNYSNDAGSDLANLHITTLEMDADNGAVANAEITVNGNTQIADANGETTFVDVPVNAEITISFGNHPTDPSFTAPADIVFAADELAENTTHDIVAYYVPTANAVTLNVSTLAEDTLANVNGEINLIANGSIPLLYGYGTATIIVNNDPAYTYDIDWGPTSPASDYIEPAVDPQPVDLTGVAAGSTVDVIGYYRVCPGAECAVVEITAYAGTSYPADAIPANIANAIDITVTSTLLGTTTGNGQLSGTYVVGEDIDIEFEDLDLYETPYIYINGVNVANLHNITHTVSNVVAENTVDAMFAVDADAVGFTIATEDHEGTPLSENYTRGGSPEMSTPDTFAVDVTDLTPSYTITFADRAGYVTPDDIVITDGNLTTVPAGVTITENGTPYVAGTDFVTGVTYDIVGTYEPKMLVTKEITNDETIVNNNHRVDYTITVERNSRDITAGDLTITLHDTLLDGAGTLTGSNGGTMSAVLQGSDYSTCSNGCGDIVTGDVDVTIDNPGNSVTITYQLLSDNSSIPTGQTSNFTNEVIGSYVDDSENVEHEVSTVVIVSAQPTTNGGGSTGGSGGGGGHLLINGDMVLEFEKLISLDGQTFVEANDEENALSIPENTTSTLYNKVRLTNVGQVSAVNVEITQGFEQGDSEMTAGEMENLQGAEKNEDGYIEIDKIVVGETFEFTYEVEITENGTDGEFAQEYIELLGFESSLPDSQDGLDYQGIGEKTESYLMAGDPTSYTSSDEHLRITVTSDKEEANIGDPVTFVITVENLTDEDVTGLTVTHDYPENALAITNPFGGRDDGKEIHWTRAMLRPGEKFTFQVNAIVTDDAPINTTVRGVTRALVSEYENIPQVENLLRIGGISPAVDPGIIELAQTGPAQVLLLLIISILAYFGYQAYSARKYAIIKKAALRTI